MPQNCILSTCTNSPKYTTENPAPNTGSQLLKVILTISTLTYTNYNSNGEIIILLWNMDANIVLNINECNEFCSNITSMIDLYDRFDLNCINAQKNIPLH
jgi:hypothetical protein